MTTKKTVRLSENRKQKLYNDVTEVVMKERIKVGGGKFEIYNRREVDDLLSEIQHKVGDAAIQSLNQNLNQHNK